MLSTQLLRTPLSRRFLPLFLVAACAAAGARAETIYLLTSSNTLVTTSTDAPSSIDSSLQIIGVNAGEVLVGIDVRPQNQKLYALGVNAAANTATLYHLAPETGVAAAVGAASSIGFTDASLTPIDFPDPAMVAWDIDFNPAADRLRVVAGSLNFRVNPNSGAAMDGNAGASGVNPDGSINGGTTTVSATAYTNNQPNGFSTTQYTVDASTDSLFIQSPPNNGTQTQGLSLTLSGSPLYLSRASLDIAPGVNVVMSNTPVSAGSALLLGTVGGTTGLYSLNLVTAAATRLGDVSTQGVVGFAVRPDRDAAVALSADGASLLRFSPTNPGTATTVGISGLGAGEVLVGIDFRPQTGQLYGLGVNAAINTASLYLIDPQSGALTLVGGAGGIAFVNTFGDAVDLPDPALVGYGMDFNPTVDRVRVVTGTGLNFRVNPNTGAPVDGNLGSMMAVAGTNLDGSINGSGVTGIEAVAYTNSFGQPLMGGVTTQYTLSAVTNRLYVQNPPNAGTQTSPVEITANGAPLDFGIHTGFDIATDPGTTNSFEGWMVATVGGTTTVYRFDLSSGVAYALGTLGGEQVTASSLVVFATLPKRSLTNDLAPAVAGVPTRLNPLANDGLDESAVITSVSASAVTIEGRTLIIPANQTAPFTYTVKAASLGSRLGTATVTPTQIEAVTTAKTFNGILLDENADIIGWANATVSASGLATVQVRGGTASISAKLTIPVGGSAAKVFTSLGNLTVARQANGTLSLNLAALGGPISGILRAARVTTAATVHHIALASVDADVPGGGYAVAKTNAKAAVSVKGILPDGLPFTASTTLLDNGGFAFYTPVTKGAKPPAVLGGELVAADLAATDITGELIYLKLPQIPGTKGLHLQGVDTVLAANGSLYTAAGPALGSAGTLTLSGGDLTLAQTQAVTVSARGVPNLSALVPKWTAAAAKVGTFTASLRLPEATKNVTATGVYLPKSKTAWGYFPGTTEGGRIELTAP